MDKNEKQMRKIIYERVFQLLKKQETGNYNGATIPAFQIGFDADLDEFIEIGKLSEHGSRRYHLLIEQYANKTPLCERCAFRFSRQKDFEKFLSQQENSKGLYLNKSSRNKEITPPADKSLSQLQKQTSEETNIDYQKEASYSEYHRNDGEDKNA